MYNGGGTAVHAAELNTFVLDEYVVTANRTSERIIDTPASVSVVTAQELADRDIKNVDDALRLTTGVYTNRIKGDLDVSAKLVMRGVGQARQVLVMLDGMPLNDKNSGNVDWNAIPIEVVDRIEVVRGTASSLYGTNAVGGVVNIITKDYDKARIKVSGGYGSYGTYRYGIHLTQPINDKLSISAGYNTVDSDGYVTQKFTASKSSSPSTEGKKVTGYQDSFDKYGKPNYIYGDAGKNTFEEENWQFGVDYKIDENKKLTLKMIHNDYEYKSGTNPNTYLRDENGNPVWSGVVNLNGTKVDLKTLGANGSKFYSAYFGGKEHDMYALAYNDTENNLKISAGLNDISDNWYVSGSGALLTESPSKTWNFSVQKEVLNTDNDKLVIGVDYSQGETESIDTNLNDWRNRNSRKSVKTYAAGKDRTIAAYFENQHRFDDKWKMVVGGRYDTWKNFDGVSKYYDGNGKLISNPDLDDKEKTMFSPKVAVQYKADEETAYHISWGRSFRAPTVFELYKAAPNGTSATSTYKDSNPDLDPETIDMIEFGVKKQFGEKTALSATYFHADVDDMIYTMTYADKKYHWEEMDLDLKYSKPENAGKGKTDGIELELSHRFDDNWDMFANYTYQNARITDNPADTKSEGKKITGIPKELFNIGVGYHKDKFSGSLTGSYSGEMFGQSDNSDTTTGFYGTQDRYFLVNLALHYQLDENTRINFDINNLLNHEYYTTYVAPDRNYYFSVERTF